MSERPGPSGRAVGAAVLDVFHLPAELTEPAPATIVVLDVVRATTAMSVALEAGASTVVPAETVEEARRFRARMRDQEPLLCGERGGLRVEGFDLGNSPLEYTSNRVAGRTLIWTTTNGTRALRAAASAGRIWLGCFRNLAALVERLSGPCQPPEEGATLGVLCAGRRGRVSMDDVLCAGHLVERLARADPSLWLTDGARLARAWACSVGPPTPAWLARTEAGRALVRLGLEADLEVCCELAVSAMVPRLEGRRIVGRGRE